MSEPASPLAAIPSVDRVLNRPAFAAARAAHGAALVVEAIRATLAEERERMGRQPERPTPGLDQVEARVLARIGRWTARGPRKVLNLTGTVLHTNLGRAPLPEEAIEAVVAAAGAADLEFDIDKGARGERDAHVEDWLCRLTGAEAALVVNNNAAAVMLVLNTLALRKDVPVSRGELIEIGGSFRMPDIMTRAGCRLVEVGTTNRTHLADYAQAIGERTALLMRVHTSNYEVQGFTATVSEADLATLARERGLPLFVDLGSGSLIDMKAYGLPDVETPAQAIERGADLVSFSGDKLLGGPQAGIVVGRKGLVDRLRRNPLKRALRADKLTLAALRAVLQLYADPERLRARLPALRLLTRSKAEIETMARALVEPLTGRLHDVATVEVCACESQIGSGALPVDALPSAGLRLTPHGKSSGTAVSALARAFRELPVPVMGRVERGALVFDLRCLESADELLALLDALRLPGRAR